MVRRLLALGLVAVLLPAVAGAASVRSVTAPARVTALAFEGGRVAYATGFSARDCNRVYVWNLATRGVSKLGRKTHCEQTSTGNAIESVSLAGARVLWVHYAGGNFRDWSLWTATTTRPSPRRLAVVTRDVDAPPPIVIGPADGSKAGDLLPYAVDRRVVALRANGARRFAWTAPGRVTALAAAGGRLAVASAGGVVTVLDPTGRVLQTETFAGEVTTVRLAGDGLLAQVGRRLVLRGGTERTWLLAAGSRLEDANARDAFYVTGSQARRLRFASGAQRLLALGSGIRVDAARFALMSGRRVLVKPLPVG
jgi:hypothetical protein